MVARALLAALALALCWAVAADAEPQTRATRVSGAAKAPAAAPSPPPGPPLALTDDRIGVTTDYRGARVSVLAVNPTIRGQLRGDIVVVLRGPAQAVELRRKRPLAGLWVEQDPVRFTDAPALLNIASTRPLNEVAAPKAIYDLRLDPMVAARLGSATPPDANPRAYRLGLFRLKRQAGLYGEYFGDDPRALQIVHEGVFWTHFTIPANAPIGTYEVMVLYFRDGALVSSAVRTVEIARIGVEQSIHNAAQDHPTLYGLVAVLMALGAGWLSSLVFRR